MHLVKAADETPTHKTFNWTSVFKSFHNRPLENECIRRISNFFAMRNITRIESYF